MDSHQTEDAGLADGALLVRITSHQSRDQVGQLGTEIVSRREGCHLRGREEGREKRREGG